MGSKSPPNTLRQPYRLITDHNEKGEAVFSKAMPEEVPYVQINNDADFGLCYATKQTPVSFANKKDIETYSEYLKTPPGIMIPGGSVLRYVDVPPGLTSPMHRTVSLDYGVVVEGEVELILDSGETRIMKRGDVSVQRGTMHAWRNTSQTEWSRMLYILMEAEPFEVEGKKLGEDYGGLQVPPSS